MYAFHSYYLGIISDINGKLETNRQLQAYDLSISKVRSIQSFFRTKITLLEARCVQGFRQAGRVGRRLGGIVQRRRR